MASRLGKGNERPSLLPAALRMGRRSEDTKEKEVDIVAELMAFHRRLTLCEPQAQQPIEEGPPPVPSREHRRGVLSAADYCKETIIERKDVRLHPQPRKMTDESQIAAITQDLVFLPVATTIHDFNMLSAQLKKPRYALFLDFLKYAETTNYLQLHKECYLSFLEELVALTTMETIETLSSKNRINKHHASLASYVMLWCQSNMHIVALKASEKLKRREGVVSSNMVSRTDGCFAMVAKKFVAPVQKQTAGYKATGQDDIETESTRFFNEAIDRVYDRIFEVYFGSVYSLSYKQLITELVDRRVKVLVSQVYAPPFEKKDAKERTFSFLTEMFTFRTKTNGDYKIDGFLRNISYVDLEIIKKVSGVALIKVTDEQLALSLTARMAQQLSTQLLEVFKEKSEGEIYASFSVAGTYKNVQKKMREWACLYAQRDRVIIDEKLIYTEKYPKAGASDYKGSQSTLV